MEWIIAYFILINLITYFVFAYDKRSARLSQWRIPEKRLLGLALIGGSIGGWRAMKDFRHKVNKTKFRILIPLFILAHIGLIIYLFYNL